MLLLIEVVIAGSDPVPTFIFDEVDAGVGEASATEIGRRLATLAQVGPGHRGDPSRPGRGVREQPLERREGQRRIRHREQARQLHGDERVAEMARLLSGFPDSESGLTHARELLDLARETAG